MCALLDISYALTSNRSILNWQSFAFNRNEWMLSYTTLLCVLFISIIGMLWTFTLNVYWNMSNEYQKKKTKLATDDWVGACVYLESKHISKCLNLRRVWLMPMIWANINTFKAHIITSKIKGFFFCTYLLQFCHRQNVYLSFSLCVYQSFFFI